MCKACVCLWICRSAGIQQLKFENYFTAAMFVPLGGAQTWLP